MFYSFTFEIKLKMEKLSEENIKLKGQVELLEFLFQKKDKMSENGKLQEQLVSNHFICFIILGYDLLLLMVTGCFDYVCSLQTF